MKNPFIQIHTLTSYPAALLNRDDAGFAKRIPFGGSTRTRISSQCLKRHWRTYDGRWSVESLDLPPTVRSRLTFHRMVALPLVEEGMKEAAVYDIVAKVKAAMLTQSEKAKAKAKSQSGVDDDAAGGIATELSTGQITILGHPEVRFLQDLVRRVYADVQDAYSDEMDKKAAKAASKRTDQALKAHFDKDAKKNLQALQCGAGIGAALFGRMVTSDVLARVDAAVHVAHAFTVHAESVESDYFSAVDDLLDASLGETGSGHINSAELTTGLFYGYVVVDVAQLVSNLTGVSRQAVASQDLTVASRVVEHLVHLVATVSPGAKRGSTAPYALAHFAMVEAGREQPRTLANAFLRPVNPLPDLVENTYEALACHLCDLDTMYGPVSARRWAAMGPVAPLDKVSGFPRERSLDDLAQWASQQVQS